MELNIASVKNYEGKSLPIDGFVNIHGRRGDDFSVQGVVRVHGSIRNFGGTLEMNAEAKSHISMRCDRCAEEFSAAHNFKIAESFKEYDTLGSDEEENPDITYFSGDELDMDDIVYTSLVLSLPTKHLCRSDCKGLCPNCGANLNKGDCGCKISDIDPRLEALDDIDTEDSDGDDAE